MREFTGIIIDDEPGNIVTLSELLKQYCPRVVVEGSASNPIKGYELIKETDPDIVFLDIEMPYGNAFDLLDKIKTINFEVIFITAFDNYAIKAIRYSALDYILKPININELKEAVRKAILRLEKKGSNTRVDSLIENLKQDNISSHKIALPTVNGFRFEDINKIMYMEAEGSYTSIKIKDHSKELVSKSLKEFEDLLPDTIFCRIHYSHLININYVKNYFKGRGGYVEMEDGATIEVSARKKNVFFERFRH